MPVSASVPARSGSIPSGGKIHRLHATGFLRRRARGGFRYASAAGQRPDAAQRERIRRLAVPPAWTGVAISQSATSPLLAVGLDRAGRWQYLYHPAQVHRREERKRARMVAFIRALPALRAAVNTGLRGTELSRERVLFAMLRILSLSFLRPGSKVYMQQNDSYGLATLRPRHVSVRGARVAFDFPGKSGKRQRHVIADRAVAPIVRALLKIPSRGVFKYRADDGSIVNIRRRDVNAFLRETTGRAFTAKDFRTWAGSLLCAVALGNRVGGEPATPRGKKRSVTEALREVAAVLGNTPAVCRASYVSPVVLRAFEKGSLPARKSTLELATLARRTRLSAEERALLRLLES